MFHIKTPILQSWRISQEISKKVYMKMECYQPTGSFKIRGIGLACARAVAQGSSHLVSSSGGNAGYAVAYAGMKLKTKVTVFVPLLTPDSIKKRIALLGAKVEAVGSHWDETNKYALEKAESSNTSYIPPFDLPDIWEGHSTIIDEFQRQPQAILVAVGGGGLLMGVLLGLEKRKWLDTKVFSVETEGADSMSRSLNSHALIELPAITSIAHSLGAKKVSEVVFRKAQEFGVVPIVVSDDLAVRSCLEFVDDHKVLVEPACGAAMAPVYINHRTLSDFSRVHVIACGGTGVTMENLILWNQKP